MKTRAIGIDIGSERLKAIVLSSRNGQLIIERRIIKNHFKKPFEEYRNLLEDLKTSGEDLLCVTGRNSCLINQSRINYKEAVILGSGFLFPEIGNISILSISSSGYSLLDIKRDSDYSFKSNPKCSDETGNFLNQMIGRMGLSFSQADKISLAIDTPLQIPGRCPVILKTLITHLANNGEPKDRIIAGLFDSIADNAVALIKPKSISPNIVLSGGVSQSKRIKNRIEQYVNNHSINFIEKDSEILFLEAFGSALKALNNNIRFNDSGGVTIKNIVVSFEKTPPLSANMNLVERISVGNIRTEIKDSEYTVIGFDIGSTGSKITAYDHINKKIVYEDYINTKSDPVGSILELIKRLSNNIYNHLKIVGFGVTGSGRDLARAILVSYFGSDKVVMENEITAHARGALFYNGKVDTIFEIGGQDSKYIRIKDGMVYDAAMNETCSAGTGSFIEEQGSLLFEDYDIEMLGKTAFNSEYGVFLGSHCSVFMSNLIDQYISQGIEKEKVLAGIYDSVAKNYLQRVKGKRIIGKVVFCQGMPFKSDALAAAFAINIGIKIHIPPNPATTGSLGIAIIASEKLVISNKNFLDLKKITSQAKIVKSSFVCDSTSGCGTPANKCSIDRITIINDNKKTHSYWGGVCSLWSENNGNINTLPDNAPDPFKEREELSRRIVLNLKYNNKNPTIGITDKFQLKEIFPFFATFFNELGLNIITENISIEEALKKGQNSSDVLFCSPMMIYYGIMESLALEKPDFLFMPILLDGQMQGNEKLSKMCPVVHGSSDVIGINIKEYYDGEIISEKISIGKENLSSQKFINSCMQIASRFGNKKDFNHSLGKAMIAQKDFEHKLLEIGERALNYCKKHNILPLVIIGREYSIYNNMLNSGLPSIIRLLGAIPIPIDCFNADINTGDFDNVYWNCGQKILRAAKKIKEMEGVFPVFSTNYSCGPDSFIQHFVEEIMTGKPMLIVENDVRTGDSGIKTRVEAFMDCIDNDEKHHSKSKSTFNKEVFYPYKITLEEIIKEKTKFLVPYIGPCSEVFSACLRGSGINAESLATPGKKYIDLAKQYTSGKECSPVNSTLASLMQYLHNNIQSDQKYIYFMPGSDGPCRFGMYNILHKIILEKLEYRDQVRILSSGNDNFVEGVPKGLFTLVFISLSVVDAMNTALHFVRPVEKHKGRSNEIFNEYNTELIKLLESIDGFKINSKDIIREILNRKLFGMKKILKNTGRELSENILEIDIPTVSIDGALYIRCDHHSNNNIVGKLEQNKIRAIPEPFFAWLEYLDFFEDMKNKYSLSSQINLMLKSRVNKIVNSCLKIIPNCVLMPEISAEIEVTAPFLNQELMSESMLSVGSSILNKRKGKIDGLVLVSPHECMPSKIVESQLYHIKKQENLFYHALNFTDEPMDPYLIEELINDIKMFFGNKRLKENT